MKRHHSRTREQLLVWLRARQDHAAELRRPDVAQHYRDLIALLVEDGKVRQAIYRELAVVSDLRDHEKALLAIFQAVR